MLLEARNRDIKKAVSLSNILITNREEGKESQLFPGRHTHGQQVPIQGPVQLIYWDPGKAITSPISDLTCKVNSYNKKRDNGACMFDFIVT
jgi:hypothetical protein